MSLCRLRKKSPCHLMYLCRLRKKTPCHLISSTHIQKLLQVLGGTNTRGQANYGLRSLGPIQEEVVVVKKPYSLVKVTNAVLELRAPKAEVRCSGFGGKRNS
ncbi:hypothetical protein Tco_0019024 [Tanacetum coccineum]